MKKVLLLGISWRLLQFMTLLLKLSRTVAGCLICVCFACGLIFFYCESGKLYFMECSSDVWIDEIEICSLLFPKLFFLFFYSSFQSRSCFLYCILKIRFVLPKLVLIWKWVEDVYFVSEDWYLETKQVSTFVSPKTFKYHPN